MPQKSNAVLVASRMENQTAKRPRAAQASKRLSGGSFTASPRIARRTLL